MDKPGTISLIPPELAARFAACTDAQASSASAAAPPFCRDEKLWAQRMPIPSALAVAILQRDLPPDCTYNISLYDDEGWLFLDGDDASDSRKFDMACGTVQPGDLVIRHDAQYQGLGRLILRNQIEFFHAIGMKQLKINAAREAGGYSWARMGFLPDMPLDSELTDNLQRRYELIKPFLTAAATPDLLPVPVKQPHDLWAIADASVNIAACLPAFFSAAAQSFSGSDKEISNTIGALFDRRLRDGKPVTLGQFLLAGMSYPAFLDLNDASQLKRVGDYAGGWRYIGFTSPQLKQGNGGCSLSI